MQAAHPLLLVAMEVEEAVQKKHLAVAKEGAEADHLRWEVVGLVLLMKAEEAGELEVRSLRVSSLGEVEVAQRARRCPAEEVEEEDLTLNHEGVEGAGRRYFLLEEAVVRLLT